MEGLVLVLECSTARASWAVYDYNYDNDRNSATLVSSAELEETDGRISTSLHQSLRNGAVNWKTVRQILVGVGPGSFAGIRTALATAQGIGRACSAVLLPVRSVDAVGVSHPKVSYLGVFTEARRDSFFFTAYQSGQRVRESVVAPKSELGTYLSKCSLAVSTDGLEGVPERVIPRAKDLYASWLAHGMEEGLKLEPVYLHPAVL